MPPKSGINAYVRHKMWLKMRGLTGQPGCRRLVSNMTGASLLKRRKQSPSATAVSAVSLKDFGLVGKWAAAWVLALALPSSAWDAASRRAVSVARRASIAGFDQAEAEVRRLFYRYGEERWAPKIARAIVAQREERPFERVEDLVRIVEACVPRHSRGRSGHPARKVFQSLRIEVNQELVDLEDALLRIIHLLQPEGTCVVITFHSLEDRAVKRVFREYAKECRCPPELPICQCDGPLVKELQRKPLQASDDELTHNPRASSAKLRAVQRLTTDQ